MKAELLDMSVRPNERISEALPRILRDFSEQLRRRIPRSDQTDGDRGKVVHDVRRYVKRTRALVRLSKDCLERETYSSLDDSLRDLKDLYSQIRDSDVVSATAARISTHAQGLQQSSLTTLHKNLAQNQDAAMKSFVSRSGQARAILDLISATPLYFTKPRTTFLRNSLRRSYRNARRAAHAAGEKLRTKDLHRLRKKAKILQYQLDSLAELLPVELGEFRDKLRKLNRQLGKDRDLAMLWDNAREDSSISPKSRATVRRTVDGMRAKRHSEILNYVTLVFAEKPKKFIRRLLEAPKSKALRRPGLPTTRKFRIIPAARSSNRAHA